MRLDGVSHLTYCTNIHPASGWDEVLANLERHTLPLKARLSPDAPFGIGLRLSASESVELLEGDRLDRFRDFLARNGLYVFTLNGFPYGAFHGEAVKAAVFAPDWRDPARLDYTLRLVAVLAALLPEGVEGSISTIPLSFKGWFGPENAMAWEELVANLVQAVAVMARLRRQSGQLIHLGLEPEPGGLIENADEVVGFFETQLLPLGAPMLARALGIDEHSARQLLLEHIQICLDACHMAVEYEGARGVLDKFERVGIRVGKLQISSALKVAIPRDLAERAGIRDRLAPFAESTYLHQVIERRSDGPPRFYADLDQALAQIDDPAATEWRVHFHVPVFAERFGALASTQAELIETLGVQRERAFTRHLEIETYTWDVLPGELKLALGESIEREYRWVLAALGMGASREALASSGGPHA